MKKIIAWVIVVTGNLGLFLALIGRVSESEVVMWLGIGMLLIVVLLALISVMVGKRLLPTDGEIFGRR